MTPQTEALAPPTTASNGVRYPADSIPPECIPNLDDLIIEDGKPMENIFAEKQGRLLVEPLYHSWSGPTDGRPFLALANVGLFYQMKTAGLAPDVMVSLEVQLGADLSRRENRSYYIWELGKAPDVVIEIVSDRTGGEEGHKFLDYARIGVPFYVIFDPENRLGQGVLRAFVKQGKKYAVTNPACFEEIGLGLVLWDGPYEGQDWHWLRWCDCDGRLIPNAAERIAQEHERAEQERERAEQEKQWRERLEAQLRALGQEPTA